MADKALSYDDDLGGLVPNHAVIGGGFTHKWTIDFNTINTTAGSATDTVTIPLASTGADWFAGRCAINVKTAFSEDPGGTIMVGIKSNTDSIFDETIISSAGAYLDVSGAVPPAATLSDTFGAANTEIVAVYTTVAVAPGSFTAGEADIFLELISLNDK